MTPKTFFFACNLFSTNSKKTRLFHSALTYIQIQTPIQKGEKISSSSRNMSEAKWYNRVVYLFIVSSIAWSSYTEVAAADDIAEKNNVRSSEDGVGKWLWGGRRRATGWFPGIGDGIGGSVGGGFVPGGVGGSIEGGILGLGIGGGISGIGGSGISGGLTGAGGLAGVIGGGGRGAGTNKANGDHSGSGGGSGSDAGSGCIGNGPAGGSGLQMVRLGPGLDQAV